MGELWLAFATVCFQHPDNDHYEYFVTKQTKFPEIMSGFKISTGMWLYRVYRLVKALAGNG